MDTLAEFQPISFLSITVRLPLWLSSNLKLYWDFEHSAQRKSGKILTTVFSVLCQAFLSHSYTSMSGSDRVKLKQTRQDQVKYISSLYLPFNDYKICYKVAQIYNFFIFLLNHPTELKPSST